MTRRRDEQIIHRAVVDHIAWRVHPNVWWCHIPNGGRRSKIEAAILRGQGVRPRPPDLLIVADGKAHFLELKADRGRLSQAQRDCHEQLRRAGAEVATAFGLDQPLAQLMRWDLLRGAA